MSELDPQATLSGDGTAPSDAEPSTDPSPAPVPSDPRPPRRRSRAGTFFLGALSGCLLVFVALFLIVALAAAAGSGSPTGELAVFSPRKVAVIPVEGEIVDSRDTIELLHKYADSATVKAIVLRVNSPGGAIAPSQEIFEAIRDVRRDSGKPVVASFDSVAASGGFYIAAGCDQIVANPGSITGSIGVILQWMEVKDLLAWAKIRPQTITAGALKASGSPFNELTPEERAYLTGIVDQLHGQFIRAVAEGRKGKLTLEEVTKIADGRILTGEQAHALKLVDQLGNLDDAVDLAGKLGGIDGKPAVLYPRPRRPSFMELMSGGDTRSAIEQVLSRRAPRFLYKW